MRSVVKIRAIIGELALHGSHNKVQSSISSSADVLIIHWTLEPNCPSHLSRRIVLLCCSSKQKKKKKRTRETVKFPISNESPFSSAALTVVEKQKQERRENPPLSLKLFLCVSNTIRANSVDQPFNMQNGRRCLGWTPIDLQSLVLASCPSEGVHEPGSARSSARSLCQLWVTCPPLSSPVAAEDGPGAQACLGCRLEGGAQVLQALNLSS
ncbi:uncharacterized protein LOC128626257 [Artibeus jamaicensis]|uniref:uncharacterized protein LOC128626257 n=1 Tax=Artibeus jamaicensis TaxID=9417 RepID=UPI00235ADD02|nr:uncharacterized protein LOC128626257 [Artibeus jamaicensis]